MINLKPLLTERTVVVCIGNIDRGDDGVGPHLALAIKGKVPYEVIDAGVAPENYTGVIAKSRPNTIIIVDAIQFDAESGETRLFSGEDLRVGKVSTHDVSPKLLIEYLKSSTDADIYLLGVRPKSNKLGEGLSSEVAKAVEELTSQFLH
ncbi:MAG: hydrogenase 3 maturation endopeptidase HyCI [Candidatus Omnitrophica bacterium]|nr:hydrogenase 3 maturation endopeptidase HyCI [Candidatus Omnitrophota bacterium]